MSPATQPREARALRLLHVDPVRGVFSIGRASDLAALLRPGDLVVVNDAATLPAALHGAVEDGASAGAAVEARLAGVLGGHPEAGRFRAVLFGAGDWRTPTEHRPAPPSLHAGATLAFAGGLRAVVNPIAGAPDRLVELAFDRTGASLLTALYRAGRPVQYSYLKAPLHLWDVQTTYAARPLAVELPSAGRPLSTEVLARLAARGVGLARVTHAAGLSSTGDERLDALLPLPEWSEVGAETVAAIEETRRRGGRVIAAGTSVVRALESAAAKGPLAPFAGETDHLVESDHPPRVVDGLLTGLHDPGTSHHRLVCTFAPEPLLLAALRHADEAGLYGHEFGDVALIAAA